MNKKASFIAGASLSVLLLVFISNLGSAYCYDNYPYNRYHSYSTYNRMPHMYYSPYYDRPINMYYDNYYMMPYRYYPQNNYYDSYTKPISTYNFYYEHMPY